MSATRWMGWVVLLLLCFGGAMACDDEEETEGGEEEEVFDPKTMVKLRILHAAERRLVGVQIDGSPMKGAERVPPHRDRLLESAAPAGHHWISLHSIQGDEIGATHADFKAGKSYLLLLAGSIGSGGRETVLRVVEDDVHKSKEDDKSAYVRFINASLNLPPVDTTVGLADGKKTKDEESTMFVNIGFGKSSAYHKVDPGVVHATIHSGLDAGADPLLQSGRVEIEDGEAIIFLLTGGVRLNDETLQMHVVR